MKNKKTILLSILISCGIFACNNQIAVNTISESPKSSSSQIFNNKTDEPYNSPTPVTMPSKIGTIRTFIDNKINIDETNLIFSAYNDSENYFLSINNDKMYFLNGNNFIQYNLSNSEIEIKNEKCSKYYGAGLPDIKITQPQKLEQICSDNLAKVEQGKDGNTYFWLYDRIFKFNGQNLSEIYKIPDNINGVKSLGQISIDKSSNIYFTYIDSSKDLSKSTIKKLNSKYQEEWSRTKNNTNGEDFIALRHIEVDNNGNIYFFDNFDSKIKKMTPQGEVSTIIGGGIKTELDIVGKEYKINNYSNTKFSIDNNNDLYIIENTNNRIIKYDSKTTIISLFAGNTKKALKDNQPANKSGLYSPVSIEFDSDNNAYITDYGSKTIRKVDSKTNIMSIITGESLTHGDGTDLSKAFFKYITSIYAKNNNFYISEIDRIREIKDKNIISTIAGNGTILPSSPPGVDEVELPADISIVSNAKISFVDKNNNVYLSQNGFIRKITNDNIITTFQQELEGNSITQDSKGNLYFSGETIKKLDKNNKIEIFAGQTIIYDPTSDDFPYSRDTIQNGFNAKNISYLYPRSIVSDSKDNIYAIVNYNYNAFNGYNYSSIIKISPDGIIKLIAGNDKEIINPMKLIIDKDDNLYFIDTTPTYLNNSPYYEVIKKIDNTGNISIYAGSLSFLNTKTDINNVKATDVYFNRNLTDITVDDNGFVYFSTNENKIYRIE